MKLDLREFESFPAHKHLEVDPENFSFDFDGVCGFKELSVDLTVVRSDREYYCQGGVKSVLTLECARCLSQYDAEIEGQVDFIICSEAQLAEHREEAIDNEDYAFLDSTGQVADISDIVRQSVLLTLPMKPICSEDCQGLCSSCGRNLNDGSCDCKNEEIDERWAALKDLTRRE